MDWESTMASPAMQIVDEALKPAKRNLALFESLLEGKYIDFKMDSVPLLYDYTQSMLSEMQEALKLRVDSRQLFPSLLNTTEGILQLIKQDINVIRKIASMAEEGFLQEGLAQELEARTSRIECEMKDEIASRPATKKGANVRLDQVADGNMSGSVLSSREDEISRVRLCLTVEDTNLPPDHTLQVPAVEFHESLLLVHSTTIGTLLAAKRSDSGRFDMKDKLAWDREVSTVNESFFEQKKGLYLDRLVMFAARAINGPFVGLKLQAQEVQKLSHQQLWQSVHTWIDWIRGKGILLHDSTVDTAMTVGTFLGARKEYLDQLQRHARYVKYSSAGTWESRRGNASSWANQSSSATGFTRDANLRSAALKNLKLGVGPVLKNLSGLTRKVAAESTIFNIETSDVRSQNSKYLIDPRTSPVCHELPQESFHAELSDIRGNDPQHGDQPAIPKDLDPAKFPFKYDSRLPRVRIYATAERTDLHFDHPDQPLYLDLPEMLACQHSVLIRQALKHKRDPPGRKKKFDAQDEMIWDPASSTTERPFPAPYVVINLEEIILNLCNRKEDLWVKTPDNRYSIFEWTIEVKHLMLRNIGEFWDGLRTWKEYIECKDIVLFSENKARENAIDVAIFLGALPAFVRKLCTGGGLDLDGEPVDLNPLRGRKDPAKTDPEEPSHFLETDKRIIADVKQASLQKPRTPQLPISRVRNLAYVDFTGTSREHMIYKDTFGHEGGPLSATRANDTHEVLEKDLRGTASAPLIGKRKRGVKSAKEICPPETMKNANSAALLNARVSRHQTRSSTKMESVQESDMDAEPKAASGTRTGWLRRSERPRAAKSYGYESDDDDENPELTAEVDDVDDLPTVHPQTFSQPNLNLLPLDEIVEAQRAVLGRVHHALQAQVVATSTIYKPQGEPESPEYEIYTAGGSEFYPSDDESKLIKNKLGAKSPGATRNLREDRVSTENLSSAKQSAQDREVVETELVAEPSSTMAPDEISAKISRNAAKDGVTSQLDSSPTYHPKSSGIADVFDMTVDESHDEDQFGATEKCEAPKSSSSHIFGSTDRPIEIADDEIEFDAVPASSSTSMSHPSPVGGGRPLPTAPKGLKAAGKRKAPFRVSWNPKTKSIQISLNKKESSVYLEVSEGRLKADASIMHNMLRNKVTRPAFDSQNAIFLNPAGSSTAKVYLLPFLAHRAESGSEDAADLLTCSGDKLWWLLCHWGRWAKDSAFPSEVTHEGDRKHLWKLATVLGASQAFVELLTEKGL